MAPQIATHRAALLPKFQGRRRVLVIEDDRRDREYFCSVLRKHGYEVSSCESVTQGTRLLETGNYDFVLVEQGSRAFEGRAVLERVLAIDRRLPTVVLTRCVDMECYLEAMQMGAADYLEKPLSDAEIVRLVETHMRSQLPVA